MEFYKTASKYLHSCDIKFSRQFLRNRMQSHPDYPSLVSFTDTLDEIGLAYSAVVADKEKYIELQYPLLAHVGKACNEDFVLVSSVSQFEKEDKALLAKWNGIAVMIQQGLHISYQEHTQWLLKERKEHNRLLIASACLFTILISTVLYDFNLTGLLLMLLNIAGIATCSLIIMHSMGKDNMITDQLCSADGDQGCDKVLHSRLAVLWKGVGLGDVGLVYFSGITIFLTLSAITRSSGDGFTLLIFPFALSVVLSVFSIWYQWKVVKKWCKLCLIILGIVWFQSVTLFTTQFSSTTIAFFPRTTVFLFGSLIIFAIVWLTIKPLILQVDKGLSKEIAVLKWKRNPDVFLSLLYKQRKVDTAPWEDDIILGNPKATLQVMIACNPYCDPCATGHKLVEEILAIHSENIGVTVRFLVNAADKMDNRTIAARYILAASAASLQEAGKEEAKHPIGVWFELMDLEKYKNTYSLLNNSDVNNQLQKHSSWAKDAKIFWTPTNFINGFQLPKQYTLADLKLIIVQICENITPIASVYNVAD